MHSNSSLSRVLHILPMGLAALAACAFARPVPEPDFQAALRAEGPLLAQASGGSDPYGIDSPSEPSTTPAAPVDTTPVVTPPDTIPAPAAAPAVPAAPATIAPADTAPRAPRPRITRETTINPMDVRKGSYRNPKKALFMSLVVPGLGQAYIGQSAFTYARGAAYFATDVTLGLLWYNYSVVKYDKTVKKYRAFADQHWNQQAYEDSVSGYAGGQGNTTFLFDLLNPGRDAYCESVQEGQTVSGAKLVKGCQEPWNAAVSGDYNAFASDMASRPRSAYPDPVSFYETIGANREFIFGWDDAVGASYNFSATDTSVTGSSANRDTYNGMRQTAKDYSRMQTWFIGGIVLNHIASAVDAAFTARRHNRILYQGEASWYDRLNFDGGMAFDQGKPRTQLSASLTF